MRRQIVALTVSRSRWLLCCRRGSRTAPAVARRAASARSVQPQACRAGAAPSRSPSRRRRARRARSQRSTPAPTSTSSPAAAGWPRTRCRPIGSAGDASTSCRIGTSRFCGGSSKRRRGGRGSEEGRRTTTPRAWTRRRSKRRASRRSSRISRRSQRSLRNPDDLPVLVAHLHSIGVAGAVPVRRADRSQRRDAADRRRRSRRPRPARSRLLPEDRRAIASSCGRSIMAHVAEDARAGRRAAGEGGRRRARRSLAIETALADRGARSRGAPRPGGHRSPDGAERAAGADAELRLARSTRRRRRADVRRRSTCRSPTT